MQNLSETYCETAFFIYKFSIMISLFQVVFMNLPLVPRSIYTILKPSID